MTTIDTAGLPPPDPSAPPTAVITVCGAKTRAGGICQQRCAAGRTRCKLHGGASPRGAESPHFKHGMYSKALPKNFKATYDRLMADPDLLSGRGEVAILQVRLRELTARVGSNASIENWREAQTRFREFRAANRAGDQSAQMAALTRLEQLLEGGVNADDAWEDLTDHIERTMDVAHKEWKRLADNDMVATADQVFALMSSVAEAVLLNVKDQAARAAIAAHISRLRVIGTVEADAYSAARNAE